MSHPYINHIIYINRIPITFLGLFRGFLREGLGFIGCVREGYRALHNYRICQGRKVRGLQDCVDSHLV